MSNLPRLLHFPPILSSLVLSLFFLHIFRETVVLTSHIFHPCCDPFQFHLPCFYLSLSFTLNDHKFLFLSHLPNAYSILLQFHLSWFYPLLSFKFADQKFILMSHFSHAFCIPIQCHQWFWIPDNISWIVNITDFMQFSLTCSYLLRVRFSNFT